MYPGLGSKDNVCVTIFIKKLKELRMLCAVDLSPPLQC